MAKSTMPPTAPADGHRPDVAGLLERLRLAEAKLARRREQQTGMNETDRAAMRYLLERVDSEEITPSMIVRALHLSPASGTALIDRLVARGLVVVGGHPHDRRKKIIRPFDRNIDPDHLDPLTMQLRGLASELPASDARVVASFLEDVLAMVSKTAVPVG
ncbi:MarR family winged helix-turn-helix transcriptional regulator [Microbacterium ureisolvens]|uniref:MarR family transcriptional regulator n=1 Tax=Microbacterium ureisolvens TaxID=2781186 RepID=A0ABS7HZJ1_9MICO|nr:MarR family transcriptional regulator [Microbacterium ureisolvens]MBW9110801.1 MarR family transcriptional regulator [Microbacterium ureisolvens]